MPTKLKEPITLRIEHLENAIGLYLRCHIYSPHEKADLALERLRGLVGHIAEREQSDQLLAALKAQGIDPWSWEPPKPLTAAGHPVECREDGSVTVGCTTLTAAEVDAIIARRMEVREWPKYFRDDAWTPGLVAEFNSESSVRWHGGPGSHQTQWKLGDLKEAYPKMRQITPAEAKSLGADV